MALFRRNKTDQAGMPAEVQDYYKTEGRERTGMAWLLALGTLLATVLIVLGLFMGGRWAFRKLKDTDKPAPVAVQQDENKPVGEQPSDETQNDSPTAQPAPATSTPPVSTSTPAQTGSSRLAETGPGDNVAIFVAVSMLGYLVHRRFLTN